MGCVDGDVVRRMREEGMTYTRIADLLGCSYHAAYEAGHRASAAVRKRGVVERKPRYVCQWQGCVKNAVVALVFGRDEGQDVQVPGLGYCDTHAAAVRQLFFVSAESRPGEDRVKCRGVTRKGRACERDPVRDGYCPSHASDREDVDWDAVADALPGDPAEDVIVGALEEKLRRLAALT